MRMKPDINKHVHVPVIKMHIFKFIDLSQSYILKKNGFTIHLTCLARNIQNMFSNDHKYLSNLKYLKV